MLGNFTYENSTILHFGKDAMNALKEELGKYGRNVLLTYGGGSIKRNGIYDQVITTLKDADRNVFEEAGVMPNPTREKLYEGKENAEKNKIDLILAVGGGSVIDYAKGVAVAANAPEDPWEKYWIRYEDLEADRNPIPVGAILTMAGTGSEMNGGSVITDHTAERKIGKVFDSRAFPKFAILNPEFTYTVPDDQMKAGIFDTMSHIMEQYFSGNDDTTSDYIMEGLMRSLVHSSLIAVKNPRDYEARSNIMWTATWALNRFVACGKPEDWEVHMLGQSVGAYTNATHGMTLSAVSMPYYRLIEKYDNHQFIKFAENVWNIQTEGKDKEEIAKEGLDALENWMKQIGVVMNLTDLGVKDDMLEEIAYGAPLNNGGYHQLTHEEAVMILRESL